MGIKLNCGIFQGSLELLSCLKSKEAELEHELNCVKPNCNLTEQLDELHNYNSMKDATQSLLGSISMQTGISVTELHKQFNIEVRTCLSHYSALHLLYLL